MEIKTIRPKKPLYNVKATFDALEAEMYRFVLAAEKKFATYPTQKPTVSGYRRTGTLKRSWFSYVERTAAHIMGRVASSPEVFLRAYYHPVLKDGSLGKARRITKPYSTYVMGKKQSKEMAGRDWLKVPDWFKKEWAKQRARFQREFSVTRR